MGLREKVADIFHKYPEPSPSPERGLTAGITMVDPRDQIRAMITSQDWSMTGGVYSQWSGEKYPGALNYASLWSANYTELRRRSRIAYWDSMQARSIIARRVGSEVNAGLTLESQPVWDILGREWMGTGETVSDRRREKTRQIEARFHLWANSKEADAAGRLTFYQLQEFARRNKYRDGEVFVIFRYSSDRRRQNPLNLQFVWPEQIRNPDSQKYYDDAKTRGNTISHGIEFDPNGAEVAFYVEDAKTAETVRIPAWGPKSRRIYMRHDMNHDSVGQPRGIPSLSHLAHEIQKVADYTVAEIEGAIINAIYVLAVTPSESKGASNALTGVAPKDNSTVPVTDVSPLSNLQTGYVNKPGLIVERLQAGEKIEAIRKESPNVNFEKFIDSMTAIMGPSVDVPPEVLKTQFDANYSASKAAIEFFWHSVVKGRADLAAGLLNDVYEMWLTEEVKAGNIELPGWGQPVTRRAWLNCTWVGISKPSTDPMKDANSAAKNIAEGLTTREKESRQLNGSDFWDNVSRLKNENDQLAQANASVTPATMAPDPSAQEGTNATND